MKHWSTPHPDRRTSWKDLLPNVQEAGWALGPIWMGAVNFAPATGIPLGSRPTDWAIVNYWPTATKQSWFVGKWHFVLSVLCENASAGSRNGD